MEKWVISLSLLCVGSSFAATGSEKNSLNLDVGAFLSNVNQRYVVPSAYQSDVSSLTGFLRIRKSFPIYGRLQFDPSIGVPVPWQSSEDGFAKTLNFIFGLDFALRVFSFLHFRAGPGVIWLATVSVPAAVKLDNGTSTSTFYMPGGVSNGILFSLETGLRFQISPRFSLGLDFYAIQIGNQARRRYHTSATFGVAL